MAPIEGDTRHDSRCLKFNEIDWTAPIQVNQDVVENEPGEVVLKVDNLKKYYSVSGSAFGGGEGKTVKANETLSFEARESETLAIVGESGCGKSTFAKVLMGLETATSGEIKLGNLDIGHMPVESRGAKTVSQVQMVFQNPFDTLNPSMTIGDQIIRVLQQFEIGDSDADREERMLELLDLVKLPREFAVRMPRQLSGGQKQRILLARALYKKPRILFMDEATSHLDTENEKRINQHIQNLSITRVIIAHRPETIAMADRVFKLESGRLAEITDEVNQVLTNTHI